MVWLLITSGPLNQPPSDQFRNFDDEANSLMNSLTNLDAEDEPRRGLGATSRANSVRFDETANQNHFTHSSRPSAEFLSRSSSGGLGALQMNERSSSHKSDGRASSVHSVRSAASGRANSLNMDSGYGVADSRPSSIEPPSIPPGMMFVGFAPAIVRCWLSTSFDDFRYDSMLYAVVSTGSYKSSVDLGLVRKLTYDGLISEPDEDGARTVRLPVAFPEAVVHPARSNPITIGPTPPPTPVPSVTVTFQIIESAGDGSDNLIQIFLGSDVLRNHSADILFSSNSMSMFVEARRKIHIPLVRPENDEIFKSLYVTSGTPATVPQSQQQSSNDRPHQYTQNQGSSIASASSGATSPRPTVNYGTPDAQGAASSTTDSAKGGAGAGTDSDPHPGSRQSSATRPSLNLKTTRAEASDATTQSAEAALSAPPRSDLTSSPWHSSNWRRDSSSTATPATATPGTASAIGTEWPPPSRTRETSFQRRDPAGKLVFKTKTPSRAFSSAGAPTAPIAAGDGGSAAPTSASGKTSRFFGDGRRKSETEGKAVGGDVEKKEEQPAPAATSTAETNAADSRASQNRASSINNMGSGGAFKFL